jgi:hypothetical protein
LLTTSNAKITGTPNSPSEMSERNDENFKWQGPKICVPVAVVQALDVGAPFLNGLGGGKSILMDLVPPLAKLAAVIGPPELLDDVLLLELELLDVELLLELELLDVELLLELELLEELEVELELLELEPFPLLVPPQPNMLRTGPATAVAPRILTILRREASAVTDALISILWSVIVFTILAVVCYVGYLRPNVTPEAIKNCDSVSYLRKFFVGMGKDNLVWQCWG